MTNAQSKIIIRTDYIPFAIHYKRQIIGSGNDGKSGQCFHFAENDANGFGLLGIKKLGTDHVLAGTKSVVYN